MTIQRYDSGILASNMYVLAEGGHAIVIDPAPDTAPGSDLTVDKLIVTHEHYDHIAGVNLWKAYCHAPLLCSAACAKRLGDPRKNQARYFDAFCTLQTWMELEKKPTVDMNYTCCADEVFTGDTELLWQGHVLRLVELPGHSPGSIGVFLDHTDFFSGDSLLKGHSVELRFPGGSPKQWKEIAEPLIRSIPKGTRIWPGHFDSYEL